MAPPTYAQASGEGFRDHQPHLPDNKMERDIIAAIEGAEDEDGKPASTLMRATQGGPERASFATPLHFLLDVGTGPFPKDRV